jgi:hypothetical protein
MQEITEYCGSELRMMWTISRPKVVYIEKEWE